MSWCSFCSAFKEGARSGSPRATLRIREYLDSRGVFSIPQVAIRTGLTTPDGHEELLIDYLCDHPGCPNIATHVLGCALDLRLAAAVCDEHAPKAH
jgi:hypothetical protein